MNVFSISFRQVSVLCGAVLCLSALTQACSSDDPKDHTGEGAQAATIAPPGAPSGEPTPSIEPLPTVDPTPTGDLVAPSGDLKVEPINAGPAVNCPAQRVAVSDRTESSACTTAIAACDRACTALGCGGCDNSSIYYRNGHCGGSYVNDGSGTPLPQGISGACRTRP